MPNTTDTLVKNRLESLISNYSEEDVEASWNFNVNTQFQKLI